MSSFPPRFGHLVTRRVVKAKLLPTYADAHRLDEAEAEQRLETALAGRLWSELLSAAWVSLTEKKRRLDDEGLLEKLAGALAERPDRRGKAAKLTPGWSAFLVLLDLEAGTASDAVRRVLETPDGQARTRQGLNEVGAFLAAELLKK